MFLLTGYGSDTTLLRNAGVEIDPETCGPVFDAETFETNVPGLYVVGAMVAGVQSGRIFIENGRFHGEQVIEAIAAQLSVDQALARAQLGKTSKLLLKACRASSLRASPLSVPAPLVLGDDHLHLQQLDQRPAAGEQAVALEERLLLDRLELEVLRERVDQILVGHRRRDLAARRRGPSGWGTSSASSRRRARRISSRSSPLAGTSAMLSTWASR